MSYPMMFLAHAEQFNIILLISFLPHFFDFRLRHSHSLNYSSGLHSNRESHHDVKGCYNFLRKCNMRTVRRSKISTLCFNIKNDQYGHYIIWIKTWRAKHSFRWSIFYCNAQRRQSVVCVSWKSGEKIILLNDFHTYSPHCAKKN